MTFLIDTNACLDFLLKRNDRVVAKLPTMAGRLTVSTITVAELRVGARRSYEPIQDARVLDIFLSVVDVAPFDEAAASAYGEMARRIGVRRSSFDGLIAAHALSRDLTLVTNDTRDFADIPGLRVENWTE